MGEGEGRFSGDFDTSGDKNVPLICMDLVRNYKMSFAKYQNFRLRRAAQTTIRIVALLIYRDTCDNSSVISAVFFISDVYLNVKYILDILAKN